MLPKKRTNKNFFWFRVVCIIAIFVSLFLIYEHFSEEASKYCSFGKSFDCGIVNKSPYASIDGILYFLMFDLDIQVPLSNLSQYGLVVDLVTTNAFWGFLMFFFLFLSICAVEKNKKFFGMPAQQQLRLIMWTLILSAIYALYLLYVEFFVLRTYCILCIVLDILIIAGLVLISKIKKGGK